MKKKYLQSNERSLKLLKSPHNQNFNTFYLFNSKEEGIFEYYKPLNFYVMRTTNIKILLFSTLFVGIIFTTLRTEAQQKSTCLTGVRWTIEWDPTYGNVCLMGGAACCQ